jgi:hypothetical protein
MFNCTNQSDEAVGFVAFIYMIMEKGAIVGHPSLEIKPNNLLKTLTFMPPLVKVLLYGHGKCGGIY